MRKLKIFNPAFDNYWNKIYYPKYKKHWSILLLEEDWMIDRFELDSGLKIKMPGLWDIFVKKDENIYVQFKNQKDLSMFLLKWS